MTDTRRRVKLYALNSDRQWDDKGTGHVSSTYVERLKGISLLVRAESDGESIPVQICRPRQATNFHFVVNELQSPQLQSPYDLHTVACRYHRSVRGLSQGPLDLYCSYAIN